MMRAVNVTHAILSISSPGVSFYHTTAAAGAARDKTIALAARCNDFAAQTVADHPDDFSFFATLPLPHVDAALDEARRVADVGGRVGYGLLTSYPAPHVGEAEEDPTGGSSSTTTTTTTTGNSTTFGRLFLGDAAFDPLWEALDAESAVVFIHPTTPVSSTCGCASSYPMSEYPAPLLEFFFDTARAATSLLLARVPQRFPRLSFVLSHAGGALPPVAARIALFSAVGILPGEPVSEDEVREILDTRFFYDAAGSPVPGQVTALATGGGMGVHVAERMVYGSDFPFTKADAIAGLAERLETEWRATNAAPGGSAVQEVKKVLANGGRFLKEGRGEWL
jgi:predicted TIM-barrel fold metal-dependent hydrolase